MTSFLGCHDAKFCPPKKCCTIELIQSTFHETQKIHTHVFKMITHFLDNRHVEVLWSIDQKLVIQNAHTHRVRTCLQGGRDPEMSRIGHRYLMTLPGCMLCQLFTKHYLQNLACCTHSCLHIQPVWSVQQRECILMESCADPLVQFVTCHQKETNSLTHNNIFFL
jgi:hypothetical protein